MSCAKCSHNSSRRSVCMYLCSDNSLENKAMCLTLCKLFQGVNRCAVQNKIEYFHGVGVGLRISLPWNERLRLIMSKMDKYILHLKISLCCKCTVSTRSFLRRKGLERTIINEIVSHTSKPNIQLRRYGIRSRDGLYRIL
jgi:hypothetical protein